MSITCDITVNEAEKPRTYPYIGRWMEGCDMLFLAPLLTSDPAAKSRLRRAIFASNGWDIYSAGEMAYTEADELTSYHPVKATLVIENRTDRAYPRIYSTPSQENFILATSPETHFQINPSCDACFRTSQVRLECFKPLPSGSTMMFVCDPDAEVPCKIKVEVAEVVPVVTLTPRVERLITVMVDEMAVIAPAPARKGGAAITNIRDLREGMRVCGVIDGEELEDGMIRFGAGDKGDFHICQDHKEGDSIEHELRYGYQYSWAVAFDGRGDILFSDDYDNENLELYAAPCASDAD